MNVHASKQLDDTSGDLVRRLRQHDPASIGDLYDLYGRFLFVLVVRIVRNPGAAEDIVQEAFLRAWNRSNQLSDDYTSVAPWLASIARNCALDYLKSSQSRLSAQVPMQDADFPAVHIEPGIMASDRTRLIEESFRTLSENQKRVIQLSFYEGLSHAQIAERLHRPLGTVKGWARSAISRLRGQLDAAQFDLVVCR
jgi:RNA polymerase sigma-70 factor (ECF subfamily)